MLPKSLVVLALLLAGGTFLACGRSGSDGPAQRAEDDRSYLAVLRKVDPAKNPYLNRLRAEDFARQAQAATDPLEKIRLGRMAADERVKSGDPAGGMRELDALLAGLPRNGSELALQIESALRSSLVIAALRQGELENCVQGHCCDSCVFPITAGGVHAREEGSRRALAELDWLLAREPRRMDLCWLRNVVAMTLGEWPDRVPAAVRIPPSTFASPHRMPRFVDVAKEAGVDVMGLSGGTCLEDFDGDGHLDLLVTSWGLEDPARYFRSDGAGKFEERTEAVGLAGITGGLNGLHADADNDGDADVLILRGAWLQGEGRHPNTLLRNDLRAPRARFVDVTVSAGVLSYHPTQTAAWGDYDRDGDLDLFIGNETTPGETNPCELFENRGDGTFRDVAGEVGLACTAFVKGSAWGDVDDDGDLDLYVTTLGAPNALFENLGRKGERPRFRDIAAQAGVTAPIYGFPTWFFDYDQDGHLDLLVGSYGGQLDDRLSGVVADYLGRPSPDEGTRLYRNLGGGRFEDVSKRTGIGHPMLPMGSNFGDIDGDGWLDALFGTGAPELTVLVPNRAFRNVEGQRFEEITTPGGFGNLQKGHGVAFGDIDEDGDQDIFMTMGGAFEGDGYPSLLYENPSQGVRWLTLRLEGTASSRDAHDARVRVDLDTPAGPRTLHRVIGTGGSFGASSLQLELGLGAATAVRGVRVTWPVSGPSEYHGFELDHAYRIREGESEPTPVELRPFRLGGS